MRSIARAIAFVFVCGTCFGQVDLAVTKLQMLAKDGEIRDLGKQILFAENFKPVWQSAIVVSAKSSAKGVSVTAINSQFELADLVSISENEWLLSQPGQWAVLASVHDETGKEWTAKKIVTVGGDTPKPPDPPKPPEPPIPDDTIPNAYNVGKISFSTAPSDHDMAIQIATWYRAESTHLYGQTDKTFKDIKTVLSAINKKFSAKQCRDPETCKQWTVWLDKTNAAVKAEQVKRGTFTRENWFACLAEIASSLEAVR